MYKKYIHTLNYTLEIYAVVTIITGLLDIRI